MKKNPQCDYKEINWKVILLHFYHWITATESRKIGRIHHWRNIFFNAFSMKISSVDNTRYLQRSSWWICKDNILIFSFKNHRHIQLMWHCNKILKNLLQHTTIFISYKWGIVFCHYLIQVRMLVVYFKALLKLSE